MKTLNTNNHKDVTKSQIITGTYEDPYGDIEPCLILASMLNNDRVLIEIDSVRGECSSHLVEPDPEFDWCFES